MSDTETTEAPEADVETGDKPEDPRITKANAEAAKYRRELREAQRELEKTRAASMTEQEKLVAEARQAGATEALKASGGRLVKAELRAAAAESGVPKTALDGFLEYADLSRFVGDDGEPDGKAIEAAVKKLAPVRADFDGGARTPAGKPADMNALIRRQAGLG